MAHQTSLMAAITTTCADEHGRRLMTNQKPVGVDEGSRSVTLSVIISTYNGRDVLADCLQSIYQNPPSELYEVVVVDDASTDDTSDMTRARFSEVRLLRNDVNRHYTKSNNRAFDHARGEFLCLLNNDTIVLPQAFDRMLAFLREHPEAGAVGSRLLNADGTVQWSVKSLPDLGSALFGGRGIMTWLFPDNRFTRKRFLHFDRDATEPFVAGYISGASKMMPRKVVDEIGYLDDRMFYHVDADYCKRISDAGYKNYYLPTATVIHLNHQGGTMISPKLRFRSLLSFHVDCYVYYRKHLQRSTWSPMRVIIPAALAVRLLASFVIQSADELVNLRQSASRSKGPH